MGGKAMAHVGCERKPAAEYFVIANDVKQRLIDLFPNRRVYIIEAYAAKESFGDADILLESNDLPPDWIQQVRAAFSPQDLVCNGGVTSFDYQKLQIDIITTPADEFDFASVYFSFNDLGNLMGRIAHKMGFKYGHDGLWKPLHGADAKLNINVTYKFAEVLVSRDIPAVFEFLGYDHQRYLHGFNTLEDVFEFASSTSYFHRDIFQLHNRNAISRVRDAKRPSYTAFLKWIENKPELDMHSWAPYTGDILSAVRTQEHAHWLRQATSYFPGFREKVAEAFVDEDRRQQFKLVWNGSIVSEASGMSEGKQLGQFMAYCRAQYAKKIPVEESSFEEWAISVPPEVIDIYIRQCQQSWVILP